MRLARPDLRGQRLARKVLFGRGGASEPCGMTTEDNMPVSSEGVHATLRIAAPRTAEGAFVELRALAGVSMGDISAALHASPSGEIVCCGTGAAADETTTRWARTTARGLVEPYTGTQEPAAKSLWHC